MQTCLTQWTQTYSLTSSQLNVETIVLDDRCVILTIVAHFHGDYASIVRGSIAAIASSRIAKSPTLT
jgi:hypothetical protein